MTMSSNGDKLPSVQLSISEERKHLVQDAVVIDIPSFTNFDRNMSDTESGRRIPRSLSDGMTLSANDSEEDILDDDDSGQEREAGDTFDADHTPSIQRVRPRHSQPNHPRFSRALSLPLPSQLGSLLHPHKPIPDSLTKPHHSDPVSPNVSPFKELELELADSVQMVIQTMLQISPAQMLDPAKEQFSACTLAVPTPSMSAMFTTMKNLNYISANMAAFAGQLSTADGAEAPPPSTHKHGDFDIGELLQNVGDALSGTAAQAGVDLVLFHGDVGLKHVWVKGDESGMLYLLAYLLRQIITTAQREDTVEIGLFVSQRPSKRRQNSSRSETEDEDPFRSSPIDTDSPLRCSVELSHKFSSTSTSDTPDLNFSSFICRPKPAFSPLLLRRLLHNTGGTFTEESASSDLGRTCTLTFSLESGVSPVDTPSPLTAISDDRTTEEPSLEQLTAFVDSLKGKKVHLYASSKSWFAHHLTSYLTAWGMDVSHISAEGEVESVPERPPSPTSTLSSSNIEGYIPPGIPPKPEPRQPKAQPLSFIFIDDDVAVLKERLQALKDEYVYPLNISNRKRPSLAPHHRPRSSPQVAQAAAARMNALTSTPGVILHFTSLANYKATKDLVQSVLSSYRGVMAPIPEIMIIPKPAGPRRFLTALHTAVTKPVVDSFFSPIATTPGSPGVFNSSSFFTQHNSPRTPTVHRPSGSRSNSDRSSRSVKEILENHANLPPSPLSMQDPVEYFSDTAAKLGESAWQIGGSARAGVLLQSPDGHRAGIFFSPRADKNVNAYSSYNMERDTGHLSVVSGTPRKASSSSLGKAETSPVSFSSLHESATLEGGKPSPLSMSNQPSPSVSRQASRGSISSRTEPLFVNTISRRGSADSGTRKVASPTPPGSPLKESGVPASRQQPKKRLTLDRLAPAASNKKGKSPAESNIVPPISVLIVDDNPINRTILSTFMKKNKIKYDVASNGKEAVEKWKTGEFHLILMDIQMPVMDGIEATRTIRRIEQVNAGYIQPSPSVESDRQLSSSASEESESRSAASPYRSSVIIVALTASSLQSDRIAALGAGCNDFLTKPVSLQWLNNKLIEWGSIKALSMYADMTPDAMTTQRDQARNVAERLHVPKERRTPPSPVKKSLKSLGRTSPSQEPSTARLSSTGAPPPKTPNSGTASGPQSGTSSAFWSPGQPSAASFRAHFGIYSPQPTGESDSTQSSGQEASPVPPTFNAPDNIGTPTSVNTLRGDVAENRPGFDPNASTSTLRQGDILRALVQAKPRIELEDTSDTRPSGSTESSLSPSPSPTTPGTPVTPATSGTGPESVANLNLDAANDKLDVSLPGGCKEVYAEAGPASHNAGEAREDIDAVSP